MDTIAEQTLSSGYRFRVVQYWNHVDFYTTELRVEAPDGTVSTHLLDADDAKSWRVPLKINASNRTAVITLRGGRDKQVSW